MSEASTLMDLEPIPRKHDPISITIEDREEWLKLREGTIGGTDAPALFQHLLDQDEAQSYNENDPDEDDKEDDLDASPYKTIYALWAARSGLARTPFKTNSRVHWGLALEDAIANTIAETRGWTIRKAPFYYKHPQVDRMGASLDYEVRFAPPGSRSGQELWLPFEIKLVSIDEAWKWKTEGFWYPPPHIAVQCQHQLAVTGMPYLILGALFGGNQERVFVIERDEAVIAEIEQAVDDFWQMVDSGTPPEPDFERDHRIISQIYATCNEETLDWTANPQARDLIDEWQSITSKLKPLRSTVKEGEERIKAIKAELVTLMGNNRYADLGSIVLNSKHVPEKEVNYTTEERRDMRIAKKKGKKGM